MSKPKGTADSELKAMATILRTLEGLDGDSIQRVLDYVLGRLSIAPPIRSGFPASAVPRGAVEVTDARQVSIRDLKDEKQPESSNQMAALVAYYLSERAPEGERKDAIATSDIEKYFKQAGFKLPSAPQSTLPNAANSGYFDPAGRGLYRLNPVGYNLVVHGLPRGSATEPRAKKPKKSKNKKPASR